MLATCQELGIGFEDYSPMGGGFLSGKYDKDTKFTGDDVRRVITRYRRENMEANQPLLALLWAYAAEKRATPAQLALAWLLTQKRLYRAHSRYAQGRTPGGKLRRGGRCPVA